MGKKTAHYGKMKGFITERPVEWGDSASDSLVLIDREIAPELPGRQRWLVFCPKRPDDRWAFKTKADAEKGMTLLAVSPDAFKKEVQALMKGSVVKHSISANISTRFQSALEEEFDFQEITGWIRALCEAQRAIPCGKDDEGNTEYEMVPDVVAIEKGLKLLLSYQIGQPVQRQETVVRNVKSTDEFFEQLKGSKAMRTSFAKIFLPLLQEDEAGIVDVKAKEAADD